MDYQSVSNLKMLRYAKRLTQQELADAAGISRDTYRNIESGRSDPKISTWALGDLSTGISALERGGTNPGHMWTVRVRRSEGISI
jgi:DNA-binding XRE family transcriptional regulator